MFTESRSNRYFLYFEQNATCLNLQAAAPFLTAHKSLEREDPPVSQRSLYGTLRGYRHCALTVSLLLLGHQQSSTPTPCHHQTAGRVGRRQLTPPVKFTDGIEGIFGIWQVRVYTCRDSRLQWCVVEVVAVLLSKALWWTRLALFWRFWLYTNPTKVMNLCVCVCSTVAKINNQRLTEHTVSRQNWEVLLCVFARQMLEDSRAADEAFQTGDGLQNKFHLLRHAQLCGVLHLNCGTYWELVCLFNPVTGRLFNKIPGFISKKYHLGQICHLKVTEIIRGINMNVLKVRGLRHWRFFTSRQWKTFILGGQSNSYELVFFLLSQIN